MATQEKTGPIRFFALTHWLLHPLALFIFATLATTWAAVGLWQANEAELVDRDAYQLTWDRLNASPQPPYLKNDLKKLAFDGSRLADLSLLDRDVVRKVHAAFAVQSWIDGVHVRKNRKSIDVSLTYRKPIALVEFGDNLLLPVDRNGIVLDGDQLNLDVTTSPLRISVQSPQVGSMVHGDAWPDPRVVAAAMVAHWVEPKAAQWGISRIAHVPLIPNSIAPEGDFELLTAKGAAGIRVMWGSPPGYERANEASPEKKLQALEQWIAERGSLAELGTTQTIDIRSGQVQSLSPPTVNLEDVQSSDR
jgi:hypothetical protein